MRKPSKIPEGSVNFPGERNPSNFYEADPYTNRTLRRGHVTYSQRQPNRIWDQRNRKNLHKKGQMYQDGRDVINGIKSVATFRKPRKFIKRQVGLEPPKPPKEKDPAHVTKISDIQLTAAEKGTFPVFNEDGTFPGVPEDECAFNPIKVNYRPMFGNYDVRVGVEIPILHYSGKKYKDYSLKIVPTYQFYEMSAYVTDGWNNEPANRMYVLPAGYYRRKSGKEYNSHCEKVRSLTTRSGADISSYYIDDGYFFYNKKVFLLGRGWMVPVRDVDPIPLHAMAAYSQGVIPRDQLIYFQSNASIQQIFAPSSFKNKQASKELGDWLKIPQFTCMFQYHAPNFKVDGYTLMKVYILHFRERVRCVPHRGPRGHKIGLYDAVELFFYLLYKNLLGFYPGPAPPYTILKDTTKPVRTAVEENVLALGKKTRKLDTLRPFMRKREDKFLALKAAAKDKSPYAPYRTNKLRGKNERSLAELDEQIQRYEQLRRINAARESRTPMSGMQASNRSRWNQRRTARFVPPTSLATRSLDPVMEPDSEEEWETASESESDSELDSEEDYETATESESDQQSASAITRTRPVSVSPVRDQNLGGNAGVASGGTQRARSNSRAANTNQGTSNVAQAGNQDFVQRPKPSVNLVSGGLKAQRRVGPRQKYFSHN